MGRLSSFAFVCLVVSACSSSGGGGPAQVMITGIQPGATINLMADNTYGVDFSVSNFSLKQVGQCGTSTSCGQAYLNIDGDACNQANQPYNAITPTAAGTSTSKIFADFSLCPASSRGGNHQLTVSLHLDDGSQIIGNGNAPVQASVSVVVTGGTVASP
jgi:hypothetical protein